jgi:GNAT superfamily N-acetyltransferase
MAGRMKIKYIHDIPDITKYYELFLTTGWNNEYNFTIKELQKAIKNSWYSISAYAEKDLVGFGRIISDGIHHALIVDVIVRPDYQGIGVGRKILETLITKCKKNKIRDIQLFAASGKYEFYRKLGFSPRPFSAPGMELK